MKTLATVITYQGRSLKQLQRDGRVALYENIGRTGILYGYEVIVIEIAPEEEKFGKLYPERERYPSNEDWGSYGWTFLANDLPRAQKKFDSLLPKWGAEAPQAPNKAGLDDSEGKAGSG